MGSDLATHQGDGLVVDARERNQWMHGETAERTGGGEDIRTPPPPA